jgi:ethanolamine utilization protein EutA (predicted chaperonin)
MIKIIVTIILVSAFFILFFNPTIDLKNKKEPEVDSTTGGFFEDTYRGPFVDNFIPPKYGDIGTFVAHTSVSDEHWLSGFTYT